MLYPIQKLLEGRMAPLCVRSDMSVRDALALMMLNDYSQLPVVDERGILTGMVSEQSIVRTDYHLEGAGISILDLAVEHCQSRAVCLSPEDNLFDALDRLKSEYSVVILEHGRPVGIVTAYDTTQFFRDTSEGLILVEDVEANLRRRIEAAFPDVTSMDAALIAAFGRSGGDPTKAARQFDSLTLGQYVALTTHIKNWSSFHGTLEPKALFEKLMGQVREIRNQLAHFRGKADPIQRDILLRAIGWLDSRPKAFVAREVTLVVDDAVQKQIAGKVRLRVDGPQQGGKYAPFQAWLKQQAVRGNVVRVALGDIEKLIGEPLPPSAREHSSWWTNDSTEGSQALGWLEAGWKVEDVDLPAGEVTFHRTNTVLNQLFFLNLLNRLKAARPGLTQATRTQPASWFSFGAGRSGFSFSWAFIHGSRPYAAHEGRLRTELYIDTGDAAGNEAAFDALRADEAEIARETGLDLSWERQESKQSCRISAYRTAMITDTPDELEQTKAWALQTMLKLVDAFQKRIRRLSI